MTVCNRCHGEGSVMGDWQREQCPQCGGSCEFEPAKFDDDAAGCCVAAIGIGMILAGVALAPVARFLWEILR